MARSERRRRGIRQMACAIGGILASALLSAPSPSASVPVPVPVAEPRGSASVCADGPASGSSTVGLADGDHTYYWRVPATSGPAAGRPVLIWLHGDGGNGSARAPRFWPFTDPDGAIIVTPNGTNETWNHRAADGPGSLDSRFLQHIIDFLRTCDAVDPNRIFVGGVSRGAYMPYYLLQRSGTRDKIAAVAVNAGLLYCQSGDTQCASDTTDPVLHGADARVIHLHGTNDQAVAPPPTARYHDPVDWNVDWRVFSPMKLWADQNGCWTDQIGGPNNGVLRESYPIDGRTARVYDLTGHGAACADYQLVLVTNGGHVIDGQEGRIWAFLMDRPLVPPVLCRGRVATVVGTSGSDDLSGTGGADVIAGLGGNDTIRGRGGADLICGGGGADRLFGQAGRDKLLAKDGRADRRIDCGAGRDPRAERDGSDPRPISCG